jgi:phage protein D
MEYPDNYVRISVAESFQSRPPLSGAQGEMVRPEEGTQREAVAGEEEGAKRPRSVYASEQDALEGASNELGRIRRGTAEFGFTLAEGRTDLSPETPRTLVGFKQEIDGTNWILT